MGNVSYLSNWKPELCIQLDTGDNNLADFNRFLFKGVPTTALIQKNDNCKDAQRESFIYQFKTIWGSDRVAVITANF